MRQSQVWTQLIRRLFNNCPSLSGLLDERKQIYRHVLSTTYQHKFQMHWSFKILVKISKKFLKSTWKKNFKNIYIIFWYKEMLD